MRVFDDAERTNGVPAYHAEPLFTFLNRVRSDFFGNCRELIEQWFSRYPDSHKRSLHARLRSTDDAQHGAAFWELYMHEALIRAGYDLVLEPPIPGIATSPDFQVGRAGQTAFFLEAVHVSDSVEDVAARRRRSQVYDILDGRIRNPNFSLWVDVDSEGNQPPRARRLATDLDRWLDSLDPDVVRGAGFDSFPVFSWANAGWAITFRAMAKQVASRGKPGHRPLGAWGPGHAIEVNTHVQVREALERKGGRYGVLEAPLIIAVSAKPRFTSTIEEHFNWALFGQEAIEWSLSTSETRQVRQSNGFWNGPQGIRYTRVSATVSAANLDPWSVAQISPRLWLNPWASKPLDVELPWPTTILKLTGTEGSFASMNDSFEPHTFFELAADWPGPEDLRFEGEV